MLKNRNIFTLMSCVSNLMLGIYSIVSIFFINSSENVIFEIEHSGIYMTTILYIFYLVVSRMSIISSIFSTVGFFNRNNEHIIVSLIVQLLTILFYLTLKVDVLLFVYVTIFIVMLLGCILDMLKNK